MTFQIYRPSSVDVTVGNPGQVVYVYGDEFTDGSIRQINNNGVLRIEKRDDGVWHPDSLETSPTSVLVGRRVGIAGLGHHIVTEDSEGDHFHFHAHSRFDGVLSTSDTEIVSAYNFESHRILQADESGEFVGQNFESNFFTPNPAMSQQRYYKTGSIVPTTPVRQRVYEGPTTAGLLVFDQTYPVSLFVANSEITIVLSGFFEAKAQQAYHLQMSCDTDFSLKTNAAGTLPWFAADISDVREELLLQTVPFKAGSTFIEGQWLIDHATRKIYECSTTGVQTGTFEDNADKWDQLISAKAFDNIVTVEEGVVTDNLGNMVLSGC